MPTFGRYELGEELFRNAATVVATATLSESAGPTVVKVFQPSTVVLGRDQVAVQAAAFLAVARTQQQVASSGSSHWAPIHDMGLIPDGAYYVTTQYRLSVRKLIRGKVRLPAAELFAIADGTVKGLRELKRVCARSHGNLKASNILLRRAEGSFPVQVFLTDPTDRGDSSSEAGDLHALGCVLYELVTQHPVKGLSSWPIPAAAAWADLGRSGDRWRELCNRLLHPVADAGALTLDSVAYQLASLSAGAGLRVPIRRWGLVGAIAAVVLLSAMAIRPVLSQRPSVRTPAASPPPIARPNATEIVQRQNEILLAQEKALTEWKAAITPPAVHTGPLLAAWTAAVSKQTAGLVHPDASIQVRLEALRSSLERMEAAFPQPQGLREPFASDIASMRAEFLQRAAESADTDAATLDALRQQMTQQYAARVRQQSTAQKAAEWLDEAKIHQAKEEYPQAIEALDASLTLLPDPQAKSLRAQVVAASSSPAYKQKLFHGDTTRLLEALHAKLDEDHSAGVTPEEFTALNAVVDALAFDDPKGLELLGHVRSFVDGQTSKSAFVEYFHRALETPTQRTERMAREDQANAAIQKNAKINALIAIALASDNVERFHAGLAAINDLLKLDPGNAEGVRLKQKLLSYDVAKSLTNSIGMEFVAIKPGVFLMGSPRGEVGRFEDEIQHKVTLTRPFWMQTTPVTQLQYWTIMDHQNPSHFQGVIAGLKSEGRPVEKVGWEDAVEFCRRLSQKEGKHYCFPTEAQWEYACRAGATGAYSGTGNLDEMGWFVENSGSETQPVAQKKPNAWGLYDMHGNVWQWCSDYYAPYTSRDVVDPAGAATGDSGTAVVARGGSWQLGREYSRAACRSFHSQRRPGSSNIGFRVCVDF